MKNNVVYRIVDEEGTIRYIGSTKEFKTRQSRHFKNQTDVARELNRRGLTFKIEVVKEFNTREEAYTYEEILSKSIKLECDGGTLIGSQYGYKASESKKLKIKLNHANVSGKNNPNYGSGVFHGTMYRKPKGVPMNKWWTNGKVRVKCTKLEKPSDFILIQPRGAKRENYMKLPIKAIEEFKELHNDKNAQRLSKG